MRFDNEFQKYYVQSEHKSSMDLHYYEKQVEASMTPYIVEERELRATQMDIFSRLMRDRIIWCAGPVNDNMSTIVQAQLMFLDNTESSDITMHIDSPGGSVKSGLSMVDVMDYIASDIVTESGAADLHPSEVGCEKGLIVFPVEFSGKVDAITPLCQKHLDPFHLLHLVGGDLHQPNVC